MWKKLSKAGKRLLCAVVTAAVILTTFSSGIIPGIGPNEVYAMDKDTAADVKSMMDTFSTVASAVSTVLSSQGGAKIAAGISGGFAVAGGVVTILQMAGVFSDPTEDMLKNISSTVNSINNSIAQMDSKLNGLIDEMKGMEAQTVLDNRSKNAQHYMARWNDFVSASNELAGKMSEFSTYQMSGIREWCNESTHDGLYIVYTTKNNSDTNQDETVVTYSKQGFQEGTPTVDYNGMTVTDYIGMPSESLNGVHIDFNSWSADTYQTTIKNQFVTAFKTAADNHLLVASDNFYNTWAQLSDTGKTNKANYYADGFLKTMTYKASCKKMSEQSSALYIKQVESSYRNYCNKLVTAYEGISAALQVMYNTHVLEGETKNQINELFDFQIFQTISWMGTIVAMSDMSSLYTAREREDFVGFTADTVKKLNDIRSGALTGYDNYCYLTHGLLVQETGYEARSTMHAYILGNRYYDGSAVNNPITDGGWQLYDGNGNALSKNDQSMIVSTVNTSAILRQFNANYGSNKSWNQFMRENKVTTSSTNVGSYMTNFGETQEFGLRESNAPSLNTSLLLGNSDNYFQDTSRTYKVNVGNSSKVEDEYFAVHDRVKCDFVDANSGGIATDQTLVSRALYGEHHSTWRVDEVHAFYSTDADIAIGKVGRALSNGVIASDNNIRIYSRDVAVLTSKPVTPKADSELLKAKEEAARVNQILIDELERTQALRDAFGGYGDWDDEAVDASVDTNAVNKVKGIDADTLDDEINYAVRNADANNIQVNLSDKQRDEVKDKMIETINHIDGELQENDDIKNLDVLGINGNADMEKKLAESVLVGRSYLDENGQCLLPDTAMNTYIKYEARAIPRFTMDANGKVSYEIDPVYDITPMLMVWNSQTGEFYSYAISDETLQSLGLTVNIKLPACSLGKEKSVNVVHYNDVGTQMDQFDNMQVSASDIYENIKVQGSGHDAIVEIQATSCSPFEVTPYVPSKVTAPKTSDTSSDVLYVLIVMISMMTIVGAAIVVGMRRRQYR